MVVKVLCASCNTHLLNTDAQRLDYPMKGEMFDVVVQGWYLRQGPINLDIFCPICQMYPFFWNGSMPGAVGNSLKTRGADGNPEILTVKQILMGGYRPMVQDMQTPTQGGLVIPPITETKAKASTGSTSEWPCPECGAKKRFHRAGCSKKSVSPPPEPDRSSGVIETKPTVTCPGCDQQVIDRHEGHKAGCPVNKGFMPFVLDNTVKGHGESVFKSIKKGADTGEGPPTPEEIAQMERDRDARGEIDPVKEDGKAVHLEGKEPRYLRPGEQYVPKGA